MKYRDVIRKLEADGRYLDPTTGDHLLYHPTKPGTVTVPGGGKLGRDVPPGTLSSTLRLVDLK